MLSFGPLSKHDCSAMMIVCGQSLIEWCNKMTGLVINTRHVSLWIWATTKFLSTSCMMAIRYLPHKRTPCGSRCWMSIHISACCCRRLLLITVVIDEQQKSPRETSMVLCFCYPGRYLFKYYRSGGMQLGDRTVLLTTHYHEKFRTRRDWVNTVEKTVIVLTW